MLESSITARKPWLPASAAAGFTLKSPSSIESDVQADRLPDSKLSAKIRSDGSGSIFGTTVFGAPVEIEALVAVAGTIGVLMAVPAIVGAIVVDMLGTVGVAIGADVDVEVAVGAVTDPLPTQLALPESLKFCPAIGTNCQS